MPPIPPRLVVYVPLMHPELLPLGLPDGLSVLWPGLSPASHPFPRNSRVAVWRPAMPYSPAEAEACLTDFEALGRDMLGGTPVRAASAARPVAARAFAPAEAEALARFAGQKGRGAASPVGPGAEGGLSDPPDPADREEVKRRAHRLLLLAWLQEERVRDMGGLWRRYHAGSAALARELCPEEIGGTVPGARELVPEESMDPGGAEPIPHEVPDLRGMLPPWRFVLEHMAFFLPEDAALFTADSRLLHEAALAPCPAGEASAAAFLRACGEGVRRRLHVARASLWRLLGLPGPQAGKPWLDGARFVLMYQGEER